MLTRTKAILLLLPLAFALSILIDTPYHALWGGSLEGIYTVSQRPQLSAKGLWQASFQSQFESWFEQRLASKPVMVRSDNSLSLAVFRETAAHSGSTIVLGEQHTLFEASYINNLNAVSELKGDIPPKSPYSVPESIRRMARAARAFRSLGIDFMVVFYPSKVAALRQRLDQKYKLPGGAQRSDDGYQRLLAGLKAEHVPVVDAAGLFAQIARETPEFPLYNSGGLHWTDAGACQAVRSILEQMPLTNPTGAFVSCRLGPSSTAKLGDADLAELLNVWDHSRFLDQIPSVTPALSKKIPGGARDALLVGTSFSDHLAKELHQAGVFRNVKRVTYYRHKDVATLRWQRDILRRVVIFEQWQWCYFTVNLSEFLDDLIANSPRFADAYRSANADASDPPATGD